MNNKKLLPIFFVVGAQKCGTTTIHNWLQQNEEISLPNLKETHFFSTEYYKGINWYFKQFNTNNDIRGEVDPSLLYCSKSANRIYKYIKNPKIIIIFRKPIDRAYSNYLMSQFRGYESLSFNQALYNEENRLMNDTEDLFSFYNHGYLSRSEYYHQVNRFLKLFNKDNFLFLKFDDVINPNKNTKIYKKICAFLNIGINSNLIYDVDSNVAVTYKNKFIRNNLYNKTILRKFFKKIILSNKIRMKIRNYIELYNKKPINKQFLIKQKLIVFKSLPKQYIEWNNNQVNNLRKITNLNLEDWII